MPLTRRINNWGCPSGEGRFRVLERLRPRNGSWPSGSPTCGRCTSRCSPSGISSRSLLCEAYATTSPRCPCLLGMATVSSLSPVSLFEFLPRLRRASSAARIHVLPPRFQPRVGLPVGAALFSSGALVGLSLNSRTPPGGRHLEDLIIGALTIILGFQPLQAVVLTSRRAAPTEGALAAEPTQSTVPTRLAPLLCLGAVGLLAALRERPGNAPSISTTATCWSRTSSYAATATSPVSSPMPAPSASFPRTPPTVSRDHKPCPRLRDCRRSRPRLSRLSDRADAGAGLLPSIAIAGFRGADRLNHHLAPSRRLCACT